MTKQTEFIERNIKTELERLGYTKEQVSRATESVVEMYMHGGNWPKGKVYEELLKHAKKVAGKVKRKSK